MDSKPMKILIIEDDISDYNGFLECAKKRKDIEIVGITDSDVDALKRVKLKHPEGIVLDLELNQGLEGSTDSFEFLFKLRKLPLGYDPIVIVTTHVNSKRTYQILHRNGVDLIMYKDHPNYSCEQVINKFISLRQTSPKKNSVEEESQSMREKISLCISDELEKIGMPSNMIGKKYIIDAILYLIENGKDGENVIQYLSKVYKRSDNTITNGIKNVILHAWRVSPIEDLLNNYTARINPEKGIPTPMELIYFYCDRVKNMI